MKTETCAERIGLAHACKVTGLKPRTLQAMALRGEVPGAAKLGRLWSFDVERLRAWLQDKERAISIGAARYGMVASPLQDASIAARYKHLTARKPSAA